jgi:hypothetical protein
VSSKHSFADTLQNPQHVIDGLGADPEEPLPKRLQSSEHKRPSPKAPPKTTRRRQAAPKRQPKKAAKPVTNTRQRPAPERAQSTLVEYTQTVNVFAGLSKMMRKPLAGKDKTIQTAQV